jgi:LysM repeat protein
VSIEEIQDANPGLTENLSEGQKILIPLGKDEKTIEYTVENKETLYGISRKFNTSVKKLKELNPILKMEGLQKDQVIEVPAPPREFAAIDPEKNQINEEPKESFNPFIKQDSIISNEKVRTFSDTTVIHTVLPHETLYSISKRFMVSVDELMRVNKLPNSAISEGQKLIIPVQNEEFSNVQVKDVDPFIEDAIDSVSKIAEKSEYGIALMMPFFVEHGPGYSQYISDISTQFYMGALLAVDSLKNMGLNAKLYVYDTKNDTSRVKQILRKPEFSNIDVIIGPLYGKTIPVVAEYSKRTGVKMVCPLNVEKKVLRNNPNVFASVPSDVTLFNGVAKYLAGSDYNRVVLIRPSEKEGGLVAESFKSTYLNVAQNGVSPSISDADEVNFKDFVKKGSRVAFVYPSDEKVKVIKFMSRLNSAAILSKEDEVTVFGTKDWVNFEEINNVYKNKYSFHYPGPNYLDYYTDELVEMNKGFRTRFNTDLSKISIQAYDITTFFSCYFFGLEGKCKSLMNNFNLVQIDKGDGFENRSVFIVEQESFELVKKTIIAQ